MNNFTLRQLRYFCAIAATGSISAAAGQEHVSRSAMASALDELERSLGMQLCTRHKSQGIILTVEGQQIFDRAVSLLRDADELESLSGSRVLIGALAVGCFSSLAPTIMPVMFAKFEAEHPEVSLTVNASDQASLIPQLRSGEIELAIMYNMHLDRSFSTAHLYDTAMHVILAAGHRLASAATVSVLDLEKERMILLDAPPSSTDILGYFSSQGLSPDVWLRTPHFELARSLVARGLGYSLFIQRPRNSASYEGLPIVVRAIEPQPHLERVSIVWPAGRTLSSKAQRFVRMAQQSVSEFEPESLYETN